MNIDAVLARLRDHEGIALDPYQDTVGVWTIGIGKSLGTENPGPLKITPALAEAICRDDIRSATEDLDEYVPWWKSLDDVRQQILCELAFNMGISHLLGFRKFLFAAETVSPNLAAAELLNSKWAEQVGHRAVVLANAWRTGSFV